MRAFALVSPQVAFEGRYALEGAIGVRARASRAFIRCRCLCVLPICLSNMRQQR